MNFIKRYFKPTFFPFLPLYLGAAGFFLRLWQELKGIDENGLYLRSHPTRWLLPLLTALALVLLALPLLQMKKDGSYKRRFPRSLSAAFGSWAAAVGIAVYAVVSFRNGVTPLALILGIVSIPAALSLLLLGLFRFRGNRPASLFHGIVSVYFIIFSLYNYAPWSGEPQFFSVCNAVFASVSLILLFYYRAALDSKQKVWRIYTYLCQCALFFCCLAIPGKNGWFYLPMLLWTVLNTPIFRKARETRPSIKPMNLPEPVQQCIRLLEKAGFETWVAGGCVRDHLLGIPPEGYDLCTSAKPEEIRDVLKNCNLQRDGDSRSTVTVSFPDGSCRVSTFRTAGTQFVTQLTEDLKHRDFTVNAMAYSPTRGFADPFGGRQDLKNKVLRTVGTAEDRFSEDALRILRGARLSVRYQLIPTEETIQAMTAMASHLKDLPGNRIFRELCKFLPMATVQNMEQFKTVLGNAIPELGACIDFAQYSPHHRYDIYTHTAHVVEGVSQDLTMRWAALLHDIGKPTVFALDENGQGHFRGHARAGAQLADEILLRMKAPEDLREQAVFLIAQHMTLPEPNKHEILKWAEHLGESRFNRLLSLQEADFAGKGTGDATNFFATVHGILEAPAENIPAEEAPKDTPDENAPVLEAKDLKVNGRDILTLGVDPGPLVGECMCFLLEQVRDGLLENTKPALLEAAEIFLHSLCTDPELFDAVIEEDLQ